MELAFVIWFIGTVPSVASGLCFALFLMLALSGVTLIVSKVGAILENNEKEIEKLGKLSKVARSVFIPTIVIWFGLLLVPDKSTAYQMLAAYGVQSIAENPKAQELASDGVDVLQALMKKAKAELEKESK